MAALVLLSGSSCYCSAAVETEMDSLSGTTDVETMTVDVSG